MKIKRFLTITTACIVAAVTILGSSLPANAASKPKFSFTPPKTHSVVVKSTRRMGTDKVQVSVYGLDTYVKKVQIQASFGNASFRSDTEALKYSNGN